MHHLILEDQVFWKGEGGLLRDGSILLPAQSSALLWVVPAELCAQLLSLLSTSFQAQRINTSSKFTQESLCQVEPLPPLVVYENIV